MTTDIGTGVGEFIYCLVLSFVPFFMYRVTEVGTLSTFRCTF